MELKTRFDLCFRDENVGDYQITLLTPEGRTIDDIFRLIQSYGEMVKDPVQMMDDIVYEHPGWEWIDFDFDIDMDI